MTEQKWTSGPWKVQSVETEGDLIGSVFIVGDNLGGLVGAAHAWPTEIDSGDFSRVEANARILAAAPSMAEYIKTHADKGDEDAKVLYARITRAS